MKKIILGLFIIVTLVCLISCGDGEKIDKVSTKITRLLIAENASERNPKETEWYQDYIEIKDSPDFKEKLVVALEKFEPGDGGVFVSRDEGAFWKLLEFTECLDALEYYDVEIKQMVDQHINTFKTNACEEGISRYNSFVNNMKEYGIENYYYNFADHFKEREYVDLLEKHLQEKTVIGKGKGGFYSEEKEYYQVDDGVFPIVSVTEYYNYNDFHIEVHEFGMYLKDEYGVPKYEKTMDYKFEYKGEDVSDCFSGKQYYLIVMYFEKLYENNDLKDIYVIEEDERISAFIFVTNDGQYRDSSNFNDLLTF